MESLSTELRGFHRLSCNGRVAIRVRLTIGVSSTSVNQVFFKFVLDITFWFEVSKTGRIDLSEGAVLSSSFCLPRYSLSVYLSHSFILCSHLTSSLRVLLLMLL